VGDAPVKVVDKTRGLLIVDHITAGYRSQPIIFDVAATFKPGSITAIIGPNGAGKSTLFKALYGVARTFSGSVTLDGESMSLTPRELVRKGVAYVPQLRNIFPTMSVRENLEIGHYVRGSRSFDHVVALFPDLGRVLSKQAGKLSGGQRNMLAIGRALMSDPVVLLLDESTGGLSPMLAANLWGHLVTLARSGVCIGVIEQNVQLALNHSDYVYLLAGGRNLTEGTSKEMASQQDLAQVFLEAKT
jgi:branched-chain amino acid transport system ATP-binding protein